MKTKTGIILGSGLSKFTEELDSPELLLEDNSSFHQRKIISGRINANEVVLFSGRRHFYEAFTLDEVLENVKIAKELGVNFLIITNAAGGLNKNFNVSDLMLIISHISLINKGMPLSISPLLYSKEKINAVREIAKKEKINLRYGSYCFSNGPAYESRSEVRFLNKFGVDAVGMSTVPELMYADKLGIQTLALSCITNILSEQSPNITNHDEVIEAGNHSYPNFSRLLKAIISKSNEFQVKL